MNRGKGIDFSEKITNSAINNAEVRKHTLMLETVTNISQFSNRQSSWN